MTASGFLARQFLRRPIEQHSVFRYLVLQQLAEFRNRSEIKAGSGTEDLGLGVVPYKSHVPEEQARDVL
jgi:hypothetical protein